MFSGKSGPEIIVKGGEPVGVLISLTEYEDMLKRLGDTDGLAMLERVRSKPQSKESP